MELKELKKLKKLKTILLLPSFSLKTRPHIIVAAFCMLLTTLTGAAQTGNGGTQGKDSVATANEPEPRMIHVLSRAYNDRVVLRWAPSDYVVWDVLNAAGYVVQRIEKTDWTIDTLAIVKPWTIEKFKQKFAPADSLAGVAVQLIYGGAQTTLANTKTPPGSGSMGGIVEVSEEQESVLGLAVMLAELRPDLAEAMGLMFTDRTVKAGVAYDYVVSANIADSVFHVLNQAVSSVRLGNYRQPAFDLPITDSLSMPTNVALYWPQGHYSAYDIERSQTPNGPWQKLNNRPYVPMVAVGGGQDEGVSTFHDAVPEAGTYYYRMTGYDSFGDHTLPSTPLKVEMPDLVPPVAPRVMRIVVDRPDEMHAYATIYFHVDTVEADLKGYLPLYQHSRVKNGEWHTLTDRITAPGDTVMRVDVSQLPSGQLCVAAYDKAGNQGVSIPQLIHLEDYMAPSAPTGLKANVFPDGYLRLHWNRSTESDVSFYEVYSANDKEQQFMNLTNTEQTDTIFVDSIKPGANQAYIYYKVRAVDFSGNASSFSEVLPVVRPNYIPPSTCRIDSVSMDDNGVRMVWLQSNEADLDYHRLFRKLDTEKTWTLMGIYSADSLRRTGDRIRFSDTPKPNMRTRWVYAVETVNLTGVTSGLSMPQTFLYRGPILVKVDLKVFADYDRQKKETHLAWETGKVPDYGEWYYCIYRKGADDDDFRFLLAVKSIEAQFTDRLLSAGESAEYYMTVQYEDGRRSQRSNVVKVTAPKEN